MRGTMRVKALAVTAHFNLISHILMNSVCCNDASGLTPLHIAVNASNMKAIEILLAKGADVNCHETKRGRSALHLAVKKQAKDLISLLLRSVSSPPHFEHFSNMEQ